MKNIYIFLIIFLLGLSLIGCHKDDTDSKAINYIPIIGTYFGTHSYTLNDTTFTACASVSIEMHTSSSMCITLFSYLQTYFIEDIEVKNNGNGLYNLTSPSLNGTIDGKLLSFYYNRGNFVGSKPN
ncbi:MAG: hypothetical protein ACOYO1_18335 [Bacteroidales bacterium]